MRREGVAEGMDAPLLLKTGPQFRLRVDLLGDGDIDGARALAIGEEPDAGRADGPVAADVLPEALGERDVAILAAFALDDVDGHAVGVEIGDLEGHDLADAEAPGIGGGE